MTAWAKEFDDNPVHQMVNATRGQLETLLGQTDEAESIESLERIKHTVEFVAQRLDRADKALSTTAQLNALQKQLNQLKTHLANCIDQKNLAQLPNAIAVLHGIVQQSLLTPQVETDVDIERIRQAQESVGDTSTRVIEAIVNNSKQADAGLASLTERAKEAEAGLVELRGTIDGQKGRLDEAIASFQKQFSEAEQGRVAASEEQRKEQAREFKELAEKLRADLTSATEESSTYLKERGAEFERKAQELLARMAEQEQKAKDLLQIATNIAVTGEFHKTALEEGKAANLWRRVALFFNLTIVAAVGFFLWETGTEGYSWEISISRLVMIAVLIAPATYASRESKRHRSREGRSRRLQLELASIDPFLETLPGEKAQELKANLAGRLFGQVNSDEEGKETDHGNVFSLIHVVRQFLPK